jgi:hypothetical protein
MPAGRALVVVRALVQARRQPDRVFGPREGARGRGARGHQPCDLGQYARAHRAMPIRPLESSGGCPMACRRATMHQHRLRAQHRRALRRAVDSAIPAGPWTVGHHHLRIRGEFEIHLGSLRSAGWTLLSSSTCLCPHASHAVVRARISGVTNFTQHGHWVQAVMTTIIGSLSWMTPRSTEVAAVAFPKPEAYHRFGILLSALLYSKRRLRRLHTVLSGGATYDSTHHHTYKHDI